MTDHPPRAVEDAFLAELAFSPYVHPGVHRLPARYIVEGTLGEGGFGVVYDVYDTVRAQRVALKTIRTESAEMLLRLKNEFRALVNVRHPNIVRLYELGGIGGQSFFTMERIEGAIPFIEWCIGSPTRLERSLRQALTGLSALHAHGVVHRDIKPSNVLVDPADGRVVLIDFSLARRTDDRFTTQGAGTITYMAPEQCSGNGAPSPAVDAYALGVMVFECLCGHPPFEGTAIAVATKKQKSAAPSCRGLAPTVSPGLAALVDGLLARDPKTRTTIAEALEFLSARPCSETTTLDPHRPASTDFFVGRDDALRSLTEAQRRGGFIEIVGASGIGKTALVSEFLQRHPGPLVLHSRCHPRDHIAYNAFDALIDALTRNLARSPKLAISLPNDMEALCTMFPVLRQATLRAHRHLAHPDVRPISRARCLRAFRELFARLAELGPLILAIDDIQWGDSESALLLAELVRAPNISGLTIIATRRSDETGKLLDAFREMNLDEGLDRRTLRLSPLSASEAESLGVHLTGDAKHAAEIASQSLGHPLFIQELAFAETAGPLDALLARRIGSLTPPVYDALIALAVARTPLRPSFLSRLGIDTETLAASSLVRIGPEGLQPFHDRVTEVVLSQLDEEDLHRWHLALADAWISAGNEEERTALHLSAIDDPRTPTYLRLAAEAAEATLRYARAAALYGSLLEELGRQESNIDAGEIHEARAWMLAHAGKPAESAAAYHLGAEHAARSGRRDEAARLRCCGAAQTSWSGDADKAWVMYQSVFAVLGTPLHRGPVRLAIQVAQDYATTTLRSTLKIRPTNDRKMDARVDALWMGFGAAAALRPAWGLTLVSKFASEVVLSHNPVHRLRSEALAVFREALLGGSEGWARRRARLDAAYAGLEGDPHATLTLYCFRMVVDGLAFRPERCEKEATEGLHYAIEYGLGWTFETSGLRQMKAHAMYALCDLPDARTFSAQLLEDADSHGHLFHWFTGTCLQAFNAQLVGDLDTSTRCLESIARRWRGGYQSHQPRWRLAVRIGDALARGDAKQAMERAVRPPRPALERILNFPHLTMFDDLWMAKAALAHAAAHRDGRRRLLAKVDRVRRAYLKQKCPYAMSVALGLEAGMHAVRGKNRKLIQTLRTLMIVAAESGCLLIAALAEEHLTTLVPGVRLSADNAQLFERFGLPDRQWARRVLLPGL